jgi:uncharacterized protein with PIN domain
MRFICDVMLGNLARHMRMLGLDAPLLKQGETPEPVSTEGEPPFFLTRKSITGYPKTLHIKAYDVTEQLKEISEVIRPHLDPRKAMSRCIRCNVKLQSLDRSLAEKLVPEFVFHHYTTFKTCPSCNRVFWGGSHAVHMEEQIGAVFPDLFKNEPAKPM